MHVLIIPSEEFLPPQSHLAGIFQKHQALALQKAGCKLGVLSVRQSLSVPMLVKAMLFRLAGKKTNNELRQKNLGELFSLLFDKSFHIEKFITWENIKGLDVFRIDGFYFFPPGKHSNHFGWLKAGKKVFAKYCAVNGKPDVIHAHNAVYGGMLANHLYKKFSIPYFITEHSSFVARKLESRFILRDIKRSYLQAESLFVVSDFLGKKIDDLFKEKLRWKVKPNVLDPWIENAPMPANAKTSNPFLFISIGSLIPLKRHKDLLDAFGKQFTGNKEVQLKIAGDGELKPELIRQINELKLQGQVDLLDRLNREQVLQLIDKAHCLVLCSDFETFGVVLIEANSRGLPVIATRCGGPESTVTEENGLLCPVGDTDALAKAMKCMVLEYEKYDPQKIRKDALERFGTQLFAQKMIKEYKAAIA